MTRPAVPFSASRGCTKNACQDTRGYRYWSVYWASFIQSAGVQKYFRFQIFLHFLVFLYTWWNTWKMEPRFKNKIQLCFAYLWKVVLLLWKYMWKINFKWEIFYLYLWDHFGAQSVSDFEAFWIFRLVPLNMIMKNERWLKWNKQSMETV